MTTYKEIQGTAVQSLTSSTGTEEGQIWYSTPATNFKLQTFGAATWASAPNMPAVRQAAGQTGTQTAMVLAGGANGPSGAGTTMTYDGSTWSAPGNNLNTQRKNSSMIGIQSAAILAGSGADTTPTSGTTASESYNGSVWTTTGSINTARYGVFGGGTQAAGVIAGGSGPSAYFAATEEYNGSSWSSETSIPGAVGGGASGATSQLDMMCVGGGPGNQTTNNYYNGTSWSTKNGLSGDGRRNCSGVFPTSSSPGFIAAGETASTNPIATTETWDGTSFSSSTSVPTALRDPATTGCGTGEAGLLSGGYDTGVSNKTYEFTGSGVVTTTITTS